jgi:hypothetical protein
MSALIASMSSGPSATGPPDQQLMHVTDMLDIFSTPSLQQWPPAPVIHRSGPEALGSPSGQSYQPEAASNPPPSVSVYGAFSLPPAAPGPTSTPPQPVPVPAPAALPPVFPTYPPPPAPMPYGAMGQYFPPSAGQITTYGAVPLHTPTGQPPNHAYTPYTSTPGQAHNSPHPEFIPHHGPFAGSQTSLNGIGGQFGPPPPAYSAGASYSPPAVLSPQFYTQVQQQAPSAPPSYYEAGYPMYHAPPPPPPPPIQPSPGNPAPPEFVSSILPFAQIHARDRIDRPDAPPPRDPPASSYVTPHPSAVTPGGCVAQSGVSTGNWSPMVPHPAPGQPWTTPIAQPSSVGGLPQPSHAHAYPPAPMPPFPPPHDYAGIYHTLPHPAHFPLGAGPATHVSPPFVAGPGWAAPHPAQLAWAHAGSNPHLSST